MCIRTKSMTSGMKRYAIQSIVLTIGVKRYSSEPQLRRTCVVILTEGHGEPEDPSLPW